MPLFLAFSIDNLYISLFEKAIDVYYILDICINFNLAFETSEGHWVEKRRDIAVHYFKSYFIIDFLTSIPIGWFVQSSSGSFNKLLRLLKLPKILKSMKQS